MPRSIRVAAASDIPPGTAKEVMADDQVVALFNVDGTFYALDGVCPHAGGPLGRGNAARNDYYLPLARLAIRRCQRPELPQSARSRTNAFPVKVEGERRSGRIAIMSEKFKLGVNGAGGRMGQRIVALAHVDPLLVVAGATRRRNHRTSAKMPASWRGSARSACRSRPTCRRARRRGDRLFDSGRGGGDRRKRAPTGRFRWSWPRPVSKEPAARACCRRRR